MEKKGTIIKVSGPLIVAKGMEDVQVYDVVLVGEEKLIGEVIELRDDLASIQVYEETAGIGPGEEVYYTNEPLSVDLGPGLIGGIFDGILRPLNIIYEKTGDYIPRGVQVDSLDMAKKWLFEPLKKVGDQVSGGEITAVVKETAVVNHYIRFPPKLRGPITKINKGEFTIT